MRWVAVTWAPMSVIGAVTLSQHVLSTHPQHVLQSDEAMALRLQAEEEAAARSTSTAVRDNAQSCRFCLLMYIILLCGCWLICCSGGLGAQPALERL